MHDPQEFARFQDAEVVLARAFADYNNNRIHSALRYVAPMSLLAKWRLGINEGQNHSEKDAKNGTKTMGSDQNLNKKSNITYSSEKELHVIINTHIL